MDLFLIAIIAMGLLVIIGMAASKKTKNKAKNIGAKESAVALHMHGIPNVNQNELATIFLMEDKMVIDADKKTFELKYEQLTAAAGLQKSELLKKDKSVIGRGVVGGLVLGPLGAIIGGVSGIGQKNIKGDFLVVNYSSSDSNETNVLIFDTKNIMIAQKLAKFISERIPAKVNEQGHIQL